MTSIAATSSFPFVSASTRPTPESIESSSGETLLFERFVGGEDAAFLQLFERLNPKLHTYAARLLQSASAADDVTQSIWEKLIRMRGAPPSVDNIGGFLMRMARNECLNTIKREQRNVPFDATSRCHQPASDAPVSDRATIVLAAMERLTFDDRELLVLQIDCGYRLEEIATMKGSTPQAMWTRASRARKRLRALVTEQLEIDDANRNEPGGRGNR